MSNRKKKIIIINKYPLRNKKLDFCNIFMKFCPLRYLLIYFEKYCSRERKLIGLYLPCEPIGTAIIFIFFYISLIQVISKHDKALTTQFDTISRITEKRNN